MINAHIVLFQHHLEHIKPEQKSYKSRPGAANLAPTNNAIMDDFQANWDKFGKAIMSDF